MIANGGVGGSVSSSSSPSSSSGGRAAVALLRDMQAAGHEPGAAQFGAALRACNRDGAWAASLALLAEASDGRGGDAAHPDSEGRGARFARRA